MKSTFYALLALLSISLSACTTFNPAHPTATVYPASEPALVAPVQQEQKVTVPQAQVAATPPTVEPAHVAQEPHSMTCMDGDRKIVFTNEADIATAILTASCTPPSADTFTAPIAPALADVPEKDVSCMAQAIYHEARGESERGQAAVGWVVMNRVQHPNYPNSICGVVYDRNPKGCQFSWVCKPKLHAIHDQKAYERARLLAVAVITKQYPNPIGDALYFDGFVHMASNARGAHIKRIGVVKLGAHRFFVAYAK